MNKTIWTLLLAAVLLVAALPAQAAPLPVNVENFKFDGIDMLENASNVLDIQRNAEYVGELRFSAAQDIRNVQIQVFASGFEYSDISPIESTSRVFDADANVTYVKKFKLKLTDQVEEDSYKIRVIFSDRFNNEIVKSYNIKVDVPRHALAITDVVFYPDGAVQAGNALLSTVRIENQGEKVENDIRVEVSIPALGVSGVDYVDEIKNGGNREKGTEEIFVRIPDCAKPGSYEVVIKAWYNQLHDVVNAKSRIDVLENPVCKQKEEAAKRLVPETVVIIKAPVNDSAKPVIQEVAKTTKTVDAVDSSNDDSQTTIEKVRDVLEVVLLALIVVLVIVAAVIAVKGINRNDEEAF